MAGNTMQTRQNGSLFTSGPALYFGWGAMLLGMFMAVLDIMIVASSLNEIQASLSISPDNTGWLQTSYLIAEVIMIPLSAFLSQLLSTRTAFLMSAAGFTLMSLCCAFSWSFESLTLFRALQGFLGGAMIPITFATGMLIFPQDKQIRISIIIGMVVTIAPATGPALGGWITEHLNWRWLFLLNLVPGMIIIALVMNMPDIDQPDSSRRDGFDTPGLLLMAIFLSSLIFVLHEGPHENWFDNRHVVLFSIISVVTGLLFFWRMFDYDRPIINLRTFHNRHFSVGTALAFVQGFGMFGVAYTTTLFLGRVANLNALEIGKIMCVTGIVQFFSAPVVEWLIKLLNLRVILFIGFVLFSGGLYLNSYQTAQSRFDEFVIPHILWGFSLMCIFIPINSMAFSTLRVDQMKDASAVHNLIRNLGGAIAFATVSTLLHQRTNLHRNGLIENINPASPEYQHFNRVMQEALGNQALRDPQGSLLRLMDQLVDREAMVLAFNDIHMLMAWVLALGLLLIPFASKLFLTETNERVKQ